MTNQLIIIGNGFDLACGLKSSYGDFFREYFKERLENDKKLSQRYFDASTEDEQLKLVLDKYLSPEAKKVSNFWFEWFYKNKKPNRIVGFESIENEYTWSDIETEIKNCVKLISENFNDYLWSSQVESQPIAEVVRKRKYTEESKIKDGRWITKTEFIDLLVKDLKQVELKFVEYLSNAIDKNNNYVIDSSRLLLDLCNVDNDVSHPIIENTQVLSFNYNNLYQTEGKLFEGHVTNIHGSLEKGDIIFGIDSFKDSTNDNYIFTKTYRLLQQENSNIPINTNLNLIKFFGHGLGEADYSYFQSIFDKLNLYKSDVKLIFYYYIYDNNKSYEIRKNNTDKVYKLINEYGQTLDNKEHGKNLLHKLNIEGRISLQELKVFL